MMIKANRTVPTLITLFAVTAARAADIATTFHFNPSLSHEANPIVSVFGAGASTLLLTQVPVLTVFILVPLFLYWRFPSNPMPVPPACLRHFICLQLYGRILTRAEFFRAIFLGVPFPKNWIQSLRSFGFVSSWTIVFGSCLAVFNWWAIWGWKWQWVQRVRGLFFVGGYPGLEVFLCLVFSSLCAAWYFRREFRHSAMTATPGT